jgi:hypothetical protein
MLQIMRSLSAILREILKQFKVQNFKFKERQTLQTLNFKLKRGPLSIKQFKVQNFKFKERQTLQTLNFKLKEDPSV